MYRKLNWQGGTPREVSEIVNNLVEGKSNNTGEITLNTGWATTTTLYDERIGYNSYIGLMPVSDAAEADTAPYGSFSNNTDQTAPTAVTTAPIASVTIPSSAMPFTIKIPPTKVKACLMIPITCSFVIFNLI